MNPTIPAGVYYIADPCYLLSDDLYDRVISGMTLNGKSLSYVYPYVYKENEDTMVILSTKYGDGEYPNNYDKTLLPVDSGQIAIIPESIADPDKLSNFDIGRDGIKVEVEEGEVYDNDGTLCFSGIEVYTSEDPEEEDYYDDGCIE